MSNRIRANRVWLAVGAVVIGSTWLVACSVGSTSSSSSGSASLEAAVVKILDAEVAQEGQPAAGQPARQGEGPGQCVLTAQGCRKACLAELPHQEMVAGLKKCQEDYKACVVATPDDKQGCRDTLKVCLQSSRSGQSTQMDAFRACMQKCAGDFVTCQQSQQGGEDEGDADEDAADEGGEQAPPAPPAPIAPAP